MGSALLSAEGARLVGDRTRKRSAAHAAALPEAKKQAKKQAKRDAQKAGLDVATAEANAAAAFERKLLGAEFKFQLPPPMPPPMPPAPERKRKREAEGTDGAQLWHHFADGQSMPMEGRVRADYKRYSTFTNSHCERCEHSCE
jgi:hypothetical protein